MQAVPKRINKMLQIQ